MKFALPIILIGVAIGGFFIFTSPLYSEVSKLNTQIASYNEALNNSKSLEAERDKLVQKYNSLDKGNLDKLNKMLPDTVDNIRLILEIEKLALPYGMVLKDVKYDTKSQTSTTTTGTTVAVPTPSNTKVIANNKDYGIWDLEFSTQGTYFDFVNFSKDLEKNLRIVDISSITFSSDSGNGPSLKTTTGIAPAQPTNVYKYIFKIKTYWLKN